MRAGALNRRVTLQKPVQTTNAEGRTSTTWQSVLTVWAAIEPIQGREALLAAQAQTTLTHQVRIRGNLHSTGITARWRLAYGSRLFDIQSITDTKEAHEELILACQELELEE